MLRNTLDREPDERRCGVRIFRILAVALGLLALAVAIALISGSYILGGAVASLMLLTGLYLAWERDVFGESAGEVNRKDEDEEVGLRERVGALLGFGPNGGGAPSDTG